jgi:DNA polymerase-1
MSKQSQSPTSSANGASDPSASPILAVLDGHALFHRSFHAFPEEMSTSAGTPVNAVFGFARMVLDVYRIIRPDYLVMTFDRPTPTFRHKAYLPYKAHRPSLPDSMRAQFRSVREVVAAFDMPIFEVDGYEADDLIGTLARQATERRVRTVIATGDLDTLQLVNDWVRVTFARTPRRGEFDYFDVPAIIARYGFGPEHIVDYKGLVGDTSDNIPGVPGVGDKTATKLIQEYGSLEDILAHLDDLPARTRTLLETHREQALQSKYLATIVTEAPITLDLEAARALRYDSERVLKVFHQFEFYSLVEKLPRRAAAGEAVSAPPTPQEPAHLATPADEDSAAQLSLFAEDELQAITEEGGGLRPGTSTPRAFPAAPTTTNTLVIDTTEALDVLGRALVTASLFAFDTETDTADEMMANLVGLSFSIGAGEAFYIPVGHTATPEGDEPARQLPLKDVIERLRPAFTDPKVGKTAHNAKFDMMLLARQGVWVEGLQGDTMVAAYLINPGRRGLGLKELAFENLGVIMTPITDLIGTGRKQITMAQVPVRVAAAYAGADADMALRLHQKLDPQLAGRGVERLYREIELPLIPVLARMEMTGMLIDPPFLRQMATQLDEQLNALSSAIYASIGHEFNLNSPKQLGEVLFNELKLPSGRKTKTGYSVDAAIVEGLRGKHEMVDLLLEYRQLSKLKSTYVDGLLELVNPADHRVHTSFNQTIAATGRLSSSNPNLQNIPIRTEVGRRIRRAFLADPGMYLLTADYSQIELRILAHITHEPALVAAFLADEDIHAATAAQLFKVPLAEVRPEQRRLAKTVNFAVLYGQSAFGLANVTGMTNAEAVEFIRTYEKTFPKVREYVESTLLQARTQGFVQTLLGRRRYVPDMSGLPLAQRQAIEREAINMPIQGTNADMIKIAMVRLDALIRERRLSSRMILQVHDELVLEAADAEVESVGPLVVETMTNALPLEVPIKVELKLGRNWYDVQPLQTSAGARL